MPLDSVAELAAVEERLSAAPGWAVERPLLADLAKVTGHRLSSPQNRHRESRFGLARKSFFATECMIYGMAHNRNKPHLFSAVGGLSIQAPGNAPGNRVRVIR